MTSNLVSRLRKACYGHPAAIIPWPHRILHEAADRIERLEEALLRIADDDNWGHDGLWSSKSYPDEIARAALEEKK